MDKMINISEAGRLLGVTPRTLKRWDRRRKKNWNQIKKTLEELEKERQEEHSENNYESNANKCNQ